MSWLSNLDQQTWFWVWVVGLIGFARLHAHLNGPYNPPDTAEEKAQQKWRDKDKPKQIPPPVKSRQPVWLTIYTILVALWFVGGIWLQWIHPGWTGIDPSLQQEFDPNPKPKLTDEEMKQIKEIVEQHIPPL